MKLQESWLMFCEIQEAEKLLMLCQDVCNQVSTKIIQQIPSEQKNVVWRVDVHQDI